MLTTVVVLLMAQAGVDGGLVLPPLPPPDPVETVTDPAPERQVRVRLKGGQVLDGVVVGETGDGSLVLRLASGAELPVPGEAIEKVDEAVGTVHGTETWFLDPNRTRYLYGPSAMMLKRNELSFSQTELILSGLSWGATDWLSLQVATAVPAWFIPPFPNGFNLVLAAKLGGQVVGDFHLAGGAQALWLPGALFGGGGVPIFGLAFLSATYGTTDVHATLSVALPFSGLGGFSVTPLVTLSGSVRVSRLVGLVTENWVLASIVPITGAPSRLSVASAHGLAVRLMGEKFAADLGLLTFQSEGVFPIPFPLPWLNFTYNFSL